ncbi:MAG: sensor histidine kinase [Anaerolineales bacterium]|nr:sensor histidine kinase [Anaerolineales bacterium]
MSDKYNYFLYHMSSKMRKDLAFAQSKVRDLYKIEELEDYVDLKDSPIEHVVAALAPVVEDASLLYDYALTVNNKMELNLEEVDISAILDGVLMVADQMIENSFGLTLEEEIDKNLPTIEADAERLSQALLHYIHNAVKFTEKGGITLRVKREPNNILFEVSDTGIGIPEEKQELVFEAFETILDDKSDPRLGFGLGLKIVEHIINLHDGETWFESKEGAGSSFFFTIPI